MSEKSEWRIEMEKQGFSNREIIKAYRKEYGRRNAEVTKAYHQSEKVKNKAINRHMETKYGLARTQYNEMIESQHNQCKICGVSFGDRYTIHIDHCHVSGKVRGLLCYNCNLALGNVKDNTDVLRNMIDYLADTHHNTGATATQH